ncbi:MAG: hypothetical protein K6G76_10175 [Lachnospiraceae bacterium]|nr:hypothetical protein [Lachnospiraceae bacterium]
MDKRNVNSNLILLRSVIITIMVATFIVGTIIVFYNMLYNAKREIIIKNGEASAREVEEKLDDYLSTSTDAVKLTAYTIEGMMAENNSNQQILDYLVGQTTAIQNTVFENTSGLYGYINGEFLDGLLWEPDEDFVPTERPWYIKAKEKNGEVAMIEPYLDAQTGTILMAISKMLDDGESVVSMDITLDAIQKMTEQSVSSKTSDLHIVLDRNGYVVAHSDKEEIGKNYSEESNGIGSEIFKKINLNDNEDEGYFELRYNKKHYIVYVAGLKNDFLCVSVNNATSVFKPLLMILEVTIATIILIIIIILAMMISSNKKRLMLERLSSRLSSTADIYMSMYEINLLNDTYSEVYNNEKKTAAKVASSGDNASKLIKEIYEEYTAPSSKEDMLDFVDLDTLSSRLKNVNTITHEFQSTAGEWRRARFIVSERTAVGMVARVVYLVEDIDKEKTERDTTIETVKLMNNQISSIANIYFSMHDVNLIDDTFREIKLQASNPSEFLTPLVENAQQIAYEVVERFTHKMSRDAMHQFLNFSTLEERFGDSDVITEEFYNCDDEWCRARLVVSKRNNQGKIAHILWLIESIDDEKRRRDNLTEAAQTLNYRVSSIANIYVSAHEINITNDTFVPLKNGAEFITDIIGEARTHAQDNFRNVMKYRTAERFKKDVMSFIDLKTLGERMGNNDTITIEFKNVNDEWRRGRFVVSRRDENGGITHVMWLTEDIDNEKKEHDKFEKISKQASSVKKIDSSFLSNIANEIENDIKEDTSSLQELVEKIREYSKIESKNMNLTSVNYEPVKMVEELKQKVQNAVDTKGIIFETDINKNVPDSLHGSIDCIKNVIEKMLNNAILYTEEGSVTLSIDCDEIKDEPECVMLNVSVIDTGCGIEKEYMGKLSSDGDFPKEGKVEGSGLSMRTAKRLLEMMDSTLQVESISGMGSKFSFELKQEVVSND